MWKGRPTREKDTTGGSVNNWVVLHGIIINGDNRAYMGNLWLGVNCISFPVKIG